MITVETFPSGEMGNNTYLIYDENPLAAVIDAAGTDRKFSKDGTVIGTVGRAADVAARAEALGKRVAAVFLTHGHWDHIADCAEWKRRGATLYCSEKDAKMLTGEESLASFFRRSVEPSIADVLLKGGETVSVGSLCFEIIATPGHSEGSLTYKIENNLFTGDTLFQDDFGRFDFPDGSFSKLKKSIFCLFALEGDYTVYPGHYESTTLSRERAYNAINRFSESDFE